MFDNAFYNGGYEELTMDEQTEYIEVLKDVTGFANFFYADESYTPYVPFVVKLFPGYVSNYIMVRFFTVLSLATSSFSALQSILLRCFQQRIPKKCVSRWMPSRSELTVVSA